MRIFSVVLGLVFIVGVLWEAFETIVLPRRVSRRFRLTRLFYKFTWRPWSAAMARLLSPRRREAFLSYYGPISLLLLLGIWAAALIAGFALIESVAGLTIAPGEIPGLGHALYFSGTTFFTLGLGDVGPVSHVGKLVTVVEAGTGFGFLALVIGYLPVIYQAFSSREVAVSLLDARAGSPPSAAELLRRHTDAQGQEALRELLHEWERWSAELLESHLSYPVLAYFRSQHSNQSWLAALSTILDACAIVRVGLEDACHRQAELTFAMARHAVVDLAQVFSTPPHKPPHDRLPPQRFAELAAHLQAGGLRLRDPATAAERLASLRALYEPYIHSLSLYLHLPLPPWTPPTRHADNWQTSAWENRPAAPSVSASSLPGDDDRSHF